MDIIEDNQIIDNIQYIENNKKDQNPETLKISRQIMIEEKMFELYLEIKDYVQGAVIDVFDNLNTENLIDFFFSDLERQ